MSLADLRKIATFPEFTVLSFYRVTRRSATSGFYNFIVLPFYRGPLQWKLRASTVLFMKIPPKKRGSEATNVRASSFVSSKLSLPKAYTADQTTRLMCFSQALGKGGHAGWPTKRHRRQSIHEPTETRCCLQCLQVFTPYVLVLQHDRPCLRAIDATSLLEVVLPLVALVDWVLGLRTDSRGYLVTSTSSFLLLVVMPLLPVAMPLLLVASCYW